MSEDFNPYAVADVTEPAPVKPLPLRRKWGPFRRLFTCLSMTAFVWGGLTVSIELGLVLAGFSDLTLGTLGDYLRWALVVPAMLCARHQARAWDEAGVW